MKIYNDFDTGVNEEDIELVRKIAKEKNITLDPHLEFHLANIFKRDYLIVHRNFKEMSE